MNIDLTTYPPPLESEDMSTPSGIKAYTKRVIDVRDTPTHLPEDPWRYINRSPTSQLVPVILLLTNRETADDDINKVKKRFMAVYHGVIPKRAPITVSANGNGTYTVLDGSSTLNTFKALGWSVIPIEIVK